ncbi:MAG: hypothetical protein Q4C66_01640 [Lachnospiraceae bacterium]|nr:hypothetical protein [Lachnospiraceae bacterium]
MITIFNSECAYSGYDLKKFNEMRNNLEKNHIKYKYKVRNRMAQWSGRGTLRGRMGSLGASSEFMYEYEILVHKKDYGKVKSVL